MVKTFIVIQRHLWVIAKGSVNFGLRFWPDEMVSGGNMQHQRMGDGMAFVQHLVDHHAIIANRRANIRPRCRHIRKSSAQAVTDSADFLDRRLAGQA